MRRLLTNTLLPLAVGASIVAAWLFGDVQLSSLWLSFFGGFHPVLLHLPIGVWFVIAVCALLPTPRSVTLALWWMAALSASLAFATGLLLGAEGGYDEALLERHLWAAAFFSALCWCGLWVTIRGAARVAQFSVLAGSGLAMMVAGHYGGVMVHGDPLAAAPWKLDPQRYAVLPEFGEEVNVYHDLVTPVLGAKCVSCHGPAKQRGRLRLDTLDGIFRGGHEGAIVRAGDVEASSLVAVIELPIRHEEHMPPAEHPQLSDEELHVLKYWIENGANDQLALRVSQAPATFARVFEDGFRLLPDPVLEEQRLMAELRAAKEAEEERHRIEGLLAELPGDMASGFYFSDPHSARLVFNRYGSQEIEASVWLTLLPLLRECEDINLSGIEIGAGWMAGLGETEKLKRLNLSRCNVGKSELSALGSLPQLETLNLFGCEVEVDLSFAEGTFPRLSTLYLGGAGIDGEQLAALQTLLPACDVIGDAKALPPAPVVVADDYEKSEEEAPVKNDGESG
ncbi:hypothetical protein QEH56_02795 [Pelagicoccus enzymogenes]|uniref:c-type cytochrome domain-containing protein n=1 Tax=Pelagicoccus enzymogenes TaxID=2773457 RepID=UPI00280DF770|nr:c-type cytochrome domain-containing protein [Pelagicoccus enzymogenes]MDQ8197056.1 hypothetical protein [Pelagicoccus enzymogenes]